MPSHSSASRRSYGTGTVVQRCMCGSRHCASTASTSSGLWARNVTTPSVSRGAHGGMSTGPASWVAVPGGNSGGASPSPARGKAGECLPWTSGTFGRPVRRARRAARSSPPRRHEGRVLGDAPGEDRREAPACRRGPDHQEAGGARGAGERARGGLRRADATPSCARRPTGSGRGSPRARRLDDLLPEAFAAVREAAKRTLGPAALRRPADGRRRAAPRQHRRDEDRRGQDPRRDRAGLPQRARRQGRARHHGQRLPGLLPVRAHGPRLPLPRPVGRLHPGRR